MDTFKAYLRNAEAQGSGKKARVFDWDKAARIIKDRKDLGNAEVVAGLLEDMKYTSGAIFSDGQPADGGYTYLFSTWATPVLMIGEEIIECWVYEDENPNEWSADTTWPDTARAILNA